MSYETDRWAARRRGLDALERRVARLHLGSGAETPERLVDGLRYAISFARLTSVRNCDGVDVEVDGPLHAHALGISELLEKRLLREDNLWEAIKVLPEGIATSIFLRPALPGRTSFAGPRPPTAQSNRCRELKAADTPPCRRDRSRASRSRSPVGSSGARHP